MIRPRINGKAPLLLLVVLAWGWLQAGCTQLRQKEIILTREPTRERTLWRLDKADSGLVASIAFHPDGQRLAVGRGDGELAIWAIGAHKPDTVLSTRWNWVSPVTFAPNGQWLAWASLDQPTRPDGVSWADARVAIKVRDMMSGSITDIPISERHMDWHLGFSPNSAYLAIDSGSYSPFQVLDTRTFHTIFQYEYHPTTDHPRRGLPLYFFGSDGTLQLLALGRQWELRDSTAVLKKDKTVAPDAVTPDGQRAFVAITPSMVDNSLPLPPSMILHEGGIQVSPIDGSRIDAFLTFWGKGHYDARDLCYVSDPHNASGGRLFASIHNDWNGDHDIVVIDLSTHRYHSLLPMDWPTREAVHYAFAVSADGHRIAIGGPPGIVVLEF